MTMRKTNFVEVRQEDESFPLQSDGDAMYLASRLGSIQQYRLGFLPAQEPRSRFASLLVDDALSGSGRSGRVVGGVDQ